MRRKELKDNIEIKNDIEILKRELNQKPSYGDVAAIALEKISYWLQEYDKTEQKRVKDLRKEVRVLEDRIGSLEKEIKNE